MNSVDKGKYVLPNHTESQYNYLYMPWHVVQANIGEYVIPECQRACMALWERNIGTFMCSNRDESSDIKYIELGNLSEDNKRRITRLIRDGILGFTYNCSREAYRIYANGEQEEVATKLESLVQVFEIQDVLEGYYESVEDALWDCGFYNCAQNLEYAISPQSSDSKRGNSSPFDKINEFNPLYRIDELAKRFADSKHIKCNSLKIEERKVAYLEEGGFIVDKNGFVWIDEFYKKRHEFYLEKRNSIDTITIEEAKAAYGKGPTEIGITSIRERMAKYGPGKNELTNSDSAGEPEEAEH